LQNEPNFHYGNIIYVYTWDGKPIKKLLLAHYILDFIVLSDDSAIYAYNPSKKSLEFSTL
ncbi:TolB-like 6-bladed beta-propeller domain-containing protein, partial [Winogradskyella sp.]|nr:TolB-like 6-bladed beta-propeller domain-containing protein [Winogradskyella sp.]